MVIVGDGVPSFSECWVWTVLPLRTFWGLSAWDSPGEARRFLRRGRWLQAVLTRGIQ